MHRYTENRIICRIFMQNNSKKIVMDKETLEEAAESRFGTDMDSIRGSSVYDLNTDLKRGFIEGTKWQVERMYSEEEVKEIIKLSCEEGMLIQRTINDKVKIPYMRIKDFTIRMFEQFKKK